MFKNTKDFIQSMLDDRQFKDKLNRTWKYAKQITKSKKGFWMNEYDIDGTIFNYFFDSKEKVILDTKILNICEATTLTRSLVYIEEVSK